jgi:ATP-dependent DNA ligase
MYHNKFHDALRPARDQRVRAALSMLITGNIAFVGPTIYLGRPYLGSLLLGYYDDAGRLLYAGRAGSGISDAELKRLWHRLKPLTVKKMPLAEPPPRSSHFGSPLELSRVHWVRPELVVEVKYLTWTEQGLLRQVVYQGRRDDKPAREVQRSVPNAPASSPT